MIVVMPPNPTPKGAPMSAKDEEELRNFIETDLNGKFQAAEPSVWEKLKNYFKNR